MFRKRELTEEEQKELERLRAQRREEKQRRKAAEAAARKAHKRDIREARCRVWGHYPLTDSKKRERKTALSRFMRAHNQRQARQISRRRQRNLRQKA